MVRKYFEEADNFKKMILASLAFHAAILLVFTIQMLVFPTEKIEYQSAIRVDLVGLPEKTTPEQLAQPAPKEVPKVEIKKEEKSAPESKPKEVLSKKDHTKSLNDALLKLKKEKAIEELKKLNDKSEKAEAAATNSTRPIKGNVISPGTSLRGLDKLQYNEYIGAIQLHVQNQWSLPEWLARLELKALALVKIDKNGYVIEKVLKQSSGNPDFDRRVIQTIDAASPFPAPPDKMQALVGIDGVVLGFPE